MCRRARQSSGSLATPAVFAAVSGNRLSVLDSTLLKVIDLSNPTVPALLGSGPNYGAKGLAVANNLTYLSSPSALLGGLYILDVSLSTAAPTDTATPTNTAAVAPTNTPAVPRTNTPTAVFTNTVAPTNTPTALASATPGSCSNDSINAGGVGYVSVPDSASLSVTGNFTLAAWINVPTNSRQQSIIEKYDFGSVNGYALRLMSNGTLAGYTLDASSYTSLAGRTVVSTNAWHLVTLTYDGANLRLYVDGALDNSGPDARNPTNGTNSLKIGARGDDAQTVLQGLIAEPRIYGRALPDAEIQTLWSGGEPSATNLVSLWPLTEGSGASVRDSVGTNPGTAQGTASWSTNIPSQVCAPNPAGTPTTAPTNTAAVAPTNTSVVPPTNTPTAIFTNTVAPTNTPTALASTTPGSCSNGAINAGGVGYVSVSDAASLSFTGNFTLAAWLNVPTNTQQQSIIEKYDGGSINGYALRLMSNGMLAGYTLNGSGYTSLAGKTVVSTNAWHLVALAYDGANLRLYVDGALDNSAPDTRSPTNGTNSLKIGARGDDAQTVLQGLIAEPRIYGRALSDAEIQTLWSGGDPSATNLVSLWPLTEGSGTSVRDSVGANPGTAQGTASWSTNVPWQVCAPNVAGTPTLVPTNTPTTVSTNTPTAVPTNTPPSTPTRTPTNTIVVAPTNTPTLAPTNTPTVAPTNTPTVVPTNTPTPTKAATATATVTSTPADTTAPTVPTITSASAVGCTQVNLAWTTSTDTGGSGLKGYNVYRNSVFLKQVLAPTTSTSDTGLTQSTIYAYAVAAIDNAGNASAQSVTASVNTAACATPTATIAPTSTPTPAGALMPKLVGFVPGVGVANDVKVNAAAGMAYVATSGVRTFHGQRRRPEPPCGGRWHGPPFFGSQVHSPAPWRSPSAVATGCG